MTRATISACIITLDEEERLPECLRSVAFCDEVVVVDSLSSDATADIARAAGARVIEQAWLGFAAQRNVAIDHATSEWILEVDADERVSAELRQQIEAFLADPPERVNMGGLPIRDVFLGRVLGPSAKYPKYRHRLLRRGSQRHDEARIVHEGLVPNGDVHPFRGDLIHMFADDLSQAVADTWSYARLEAGQLEAPLTAAGFVHGAVAHPTAKLVYRLAVDGGWRDGWRGVLKIGLDCWADVLVWVRHLTGRRGSLRGRSGVPASMHYGAFQRRLGNARVVAVAAGASSAGRAVTWLGEARAAGADATLVSDASPPNSQVRLHHVQSMRPISLIRALSAEEQLRPLDAVMAFGPKARRMLRTVPLGLRGHVRAQAEQGNPDALLSAIEATRDG
jgi:Glycosyl transferase family 2